VLKRTYKHTEETKKKISVARKRNPVRFWLGKKRPSFSEEWKKKIGEASKNRKYSKKTRKKISEALKGKKHSEERKRNVSKALKGKKAWNKGLKLGPNPEHSKRMKGRKLSKETKRRMSKSQKKRVLEGKNHLWRGGISFEPYGLEFNEDLKEVIRNRDRRKCQVCEKTELENKQKLDAHHIDYDKKNNNPNNLISLCHNCHSKTNFNREYWVDYFKQEEHGK